MLTTRSVNDFGMDFYTNGKVLKLNEWLGDGDQNINSTDIVFSRDGKLALIKTVK